MELHELIVTADFAKAVKCATQTIRKNYCLTGHCYGIVPVKIGGKLLWRVSDVAELLSRGFSKGELGAKPL